MDFSKDINNDDAIIHNHKEKVDKSGVKKYVISIKNEFVPLFDSMSIDERTEIINDIIAAHSDNVNEKKQIRFLAKTFIFIIISLIILVFAAPGILWLINKSYTLTKNNYSEMQNNFEVLYKK